MFELRSEEKKLPISVPTIEEAVAYMQIVKTLYDRDLLLTGEIPDVFDLEKYNEIIGNYTSKSKTYVDIIILGKDLAQLQQKEDYTVLLTPIFDANEKLVQQYKEGNEKALNALLGKFLKENKGYEPKEVKEEIIKLIGG